MVTEHLNSCLKLLACPQGYQSTGLCACCNQEVAVMIGGRSADVLAAAALAVTGGHGEWAPESISDSLLYVNLQFEAPLHTWSRYGDCSCARRLV